MTNADDDVGTAADSKVPAGHGRSAVAKPAATMQLRMSVTSSEPLPSTKTLRMPLPTSLAAKANPRVPRITPGSSKEPPATASRGPTRSTVRR